MKYKTINKHQQQATKRKKTAKNETTQKQHRNKMAKKIQRGMNPENEKKIQRGMLTPPLPPPIKIGGGRRFVRSERVGQFDSAIPQVHADGVTVNFVKEPAPENEL